MNIAYVMAFDEKLSVAIEELWRRFEEKSIGKTPGQFGEEPHVSLFVADDERRAEALSYLKGLELPRVQLTLVPYGIFNGEKKVVFLNVAVSEELTQVRRRVFDEMDAQGLRIDPHYRRDKAILHCTLAIDVEDRDLAAAVEIMGRCAGMYSGEITRIQMLEFFPMSKVYERPLG